MRPGSRRRTLNKPRARRVELPHAAGHQAFSILCLDDHANTLHALASLFGREGWRVEKAVTLKAALSKTRTGDFDAFVVDQKLPDGFGLDFIKTLRDQAINTPAILLTGYPSVSSAIEAAKLGVGYFRKSEMNNRTLVAAVRAIVRVPTLPPALMNPVQTAIRQALEAISFESGSASWARHDASRLFASLVGDRALAFKSFVTAAAILRALLDPAIGQTRLLELLREQAEALLRPSDPLADALLDRLRERVEAAGGRWAAVTKPEAARFLGQEATILDKTLSRIGLSWPQFRRAAVLKPAVASVANSNEYVSQIAFRLGYDHSSAFDRHFDAFVGVAPTLYRRLVRPLV